MGALNGYIMERKELRRGNDIKCTNTAIVREHVIGKEGMTREWREMEENWRKNE